MHDAAHAPIRSYRAFFLFYLTQHADWRCRALHYVGTASALLCVMALIATGDWRLLAAAALAGYGFAWVGHFLVERNRPATFTYPLWSLMADHHMAWLALTGRLRPQLRAAGVQVD